MSSGLVRSALFFSALAALTYLSFQVGRLWGVSFVAVALVFYIVSRGLMPRLAHRSFMLGNYPRARWMYRLLSWLRLNRRARLAALNSCAACETAEGRFPEALELLAHLDSAELDEALRCAWLNNRAYALARSGQSLADAVESAEEAVRKRPHVAGFRHTLGVALFADGKVDEAIRELDRVWRAGTEATPLLESERCYDLGAAWKSKGESEYATDYFERCWRAAPMSPWALKARREISHRDPTETLVDLV